MIKLITLLKEIEAEQSAIANLTPEEKDKYEQALALLQKDTIDEGLKDSLKKIGLTAAVVLALLSTPGISQAQKDQLKDIAPTEMTSTRVGTQVDGLNGMFTSQFLFPTAFLKDLNSGKVQNLGYEGNQALQKINESGITVKQMGEWNNFVSWMKEKGYSGDKQMDHAKFSNKVLEEYRAENPNFWVKGPEDIKKVQDCIKSYRTYTIGVWKLGVNGAVKKGFKPMNIEFGSQTMDTTKSEDVKRVEDNYMKWAK